MDSRNIQRFIFITQLTLAFVFLVIIAGSVVRATGSGMGCPDWPKCFGKWIPPTNVSQLPENYKELYAGEHHAVAEFNALNTWTEYINRLAGAILGVLTFIQLLASIKFRKIAKKIFLLSLTEFVLIGFQGWLGAKVVASNLAPVKITIHMVVALIILSIAIAIIYHAKKLAGKAAESSIPVSIKKLGMIVLLMTIIQIMLGTQVRESVDLLLKNFDASLRSEIIEYLGASFLIHRSFSILIMVINFWMIYKIVKGDFSNTLKNVSQWLGGLLIAELIVGVVLSWYALPPALQPVHLLLGCIIYSLQFVIILRTLKR